MKRGCLLPGSPSFLLFQEWPGDPTEGLQTCGHQTALQGWGSPLGSCPRDGRDCRASRLCVESWPRFRT